MKTLIETLKKLAKNKHLLIVEDDILLPDGLESLLSKFFLGVYKAHDVYSALKLYESLDMSLVVMTDINLGTQSGIDLTYAIKAINPEQKVIAISGTEDRAVFIESIQCGIDRFVIKPINTEELFKALVNVLGKMEYDLELENNRKLLEASQEYAIKLLAEQDQFLKNAIHEIHTPLAVIITNIDLLRISGIENESLNAIEAGSRIIQNSYEDMTYLMKHDRLMETKANIDFALFIKDRVNYFNCIAEVNQLSLSLRVGHLHLPTLSFSELKLSRIVDNTLSNAIKYAKRPSEISITIGLQKGFLFFEVRNYGSLIVDKKKIFERFYRESQQKGGYGLGLNIVGDICEKENVEIDVTSTQKRGTAFRYVFKNETNLQHY